MLLLHGTSFFLLHLLEHLVMLLSPLRHLESPPLCYTVLNIVYNCVKSKIHILDFLEVIKYTSLFRTAYFIQRSWNFHESESWDQTIPCYDNTIREEAGFLKWDECLQTSVSSGQLHDRPNYSECEEELVRKRKKMPTQLKCTYSIKFKVRWGYRVT